MPLLVVKISDTREKIEGKYCDYIGTQGDSVIIVCCNCLQYQILFLQNEGFNFKRKFHVFCIDALREEIISAEEMCYGCVSQCLKCFYSRLLKFFLE